MLRCENIVLLTLRFLDVFTTLTPLSLLISCTILFPIVGLKMSSTTRSNSLQKLSFTSSVLSSVRAWTFRTDFLNAARNANQTFLLSSKIIVSFPNKWPDITTTVLSRYRQSKHCVSGITELQFKSVTIKGEDRTWFRVKLFWFTLQTCITKSCYLLTFFSVFRL
jgi:hypothetical protein